MNDRHQANAYSLRIEQELRERARTQAQANRRSLNAELGLLIEEGLRWREMQSKQATA
jgi:hypothetical protein